MESGTDGLPEKCPDPLKAWIEGGRFMWGLCRCKGKVAKVRRK